MFLKMQGKKRDSWENKRLALYFMRQGRYKETKDRVVRTEGEPWTHCIPPPCHGWGLPWAQSLSPESRTKSQLRSVILMIHCCGATGSFKQVTLAGYLHSNSLHPKLFLPVWEETLQKWGKAEPNSGFSFL